MSKGRSADRINELEELLAHPSVRQDEINALNELAWEFRVRHPEKVYGLCEKADALSRSGEYKSLPYKQGLAASLVNQAFVDTYAGRLDTAVSKCLQALALLQESRTEIEVRVWFTLGWNSFFLGDYPAALENGMKALNLAREIGDQLYEAWALDAVASFYGITSDFVTAIPLHKDALKIFEALHENLGELRTLNNLAVSLCELKQYESAIEAGYKSLQLARHFRLDMDICNNSCTVADILIGMNKFDEAESCLMDVISGYVHETNVAIVFVLERMARLRLLRNDLQGAESYVLQALGYALELDQHAEQALCHETLSKIYEKQAQYPQALEHYKKYHEIQKALQNEQAASRLAVLKITHEVDAARREAEIYRLEAVELQRKVDEQKIVQSILEFQNKTDPLTDLRNRRHFDETLAKEYSRHSRSGAELSVLIMDVDHFKEFNDTYGHVRGDECLYRIAQVVNEAISRPPDLAARYGGEEFVCLLPETNLNGAIKVAERIRLGVVDLAIHHRNSEPVEIVTISIGVVTSKCSMEKVAMELVARADEQLYIAKARGRNRVEAVQI